MSAAAPQRLHIPSLDGIRAVSFLLVFVSHAGVEKIPGLFGVAVFFFLSGFLITTLLRMEAEQTGTLSMRNFFVRRACRILPPFYLVVAVLVLLVRLGALPGHLQAPDLLATLLYATNYWNIFAHPIPMPGFNIFWSLAVEEHFYLLFPLAMLWMLRRRVPWRRQAVVLLGVCALVLGWRCVLVYHFHVLNQQYGDYGAPLRTWFATDTRIDSILFGCVLALWANPVLDAPPRQSWLWPALGAGVLLMTFAYRDPVFRETWRYTLQAAALVPIFTAAIRECHKPAFRWLEWPVVREVGVLSYTLYLVHYPALMLAGEWTHRRWLAGLLALALALGFAWAVRRWVEQPMVRLRGRWLVPVVLRAQLEDLSAAAPYGARLALGGE